VTTVAEPETLSLSPGITRPLIVALWVYAAGYLPWIAARLGGHIPAVVMPVLGLAAGAIGVRLARTEWSEREFPRRLPQDGMALAVVSGAAMAGWLWYAGIADPLHAAAWLALLTLPLGGGYWVLHRAAAIHTAAVVADALRPWSVGLSEPSAWGEVLAQAGFPGVSVQAVDTPAGVTLNVRPDPVKPVGVDELGPAAKKIAMRVAFAMPEIELREDDVRVEPAPTLPNTLIHISWKRPLRGVIPYVPSSEPRDINQPAALGVDEVGAPVAVTMAAQSGKIVSASGGGKTVVTNVQIGRITECRNALIWIGASEKLMPLVYPWLLPWLAGLSDRPVLDWVAGQDPSDVLDMLADVYMIVKLRNARNARKSKHVATREKPALIVFLEEVTDLTSRAGKVRTFDGAEWTASALLERICATCRSAGVAVYFIAQSALVDALGNHGSDIERNLPLRICGKTLKSYDGTATLPGLSGNADTTRLRDNMLYMQPAIEEPRVFPWKAYYLEDDKLIEPVAIRNAAWQPRLEPEIASRLATYGERWDDGRLPDLVRECEAEGFAWPGTRGAPERDDEEEAPMSAARTTQSFAQAIDTTEACDRISALTAEYERTHQPLPEPMATIGDLLAAANAPSDFVSTRQLAAVLDRVPHDADDDAKETAAWALGRELQALVPNLKTRQTNVGGGRKRRGYDVPRLLAAIACLRRGEELPPEDDAEAG